ncbi:MAG: type II toxin-antitoxin system HicB family antitoxin [Chloroflexi bacterium]|nr:type II toxin-antitoxin system HicB family antitoxin [Chloroflexota bacterium]
MSDFNFTGLILREDDGYSALCPELDVASQGDTIEQAKAMLLEAVALYLEGAFESGLPYLRSTPAEDDPRQTMPGQIVAQFPLKVDISIHAHA